MRRVTGRRIAVLVVLMGIIVAVVAITRAHSSSNSSPANWQRRPIPANQAGLATGPCHSYNSCVLAVPDGQGGGTWSCGGGAAAACAYALPAGKATVGAPCNSGKATGSKSGQSQFGVSGGGSHNGTVCSSADTTGAPSGSATGCAPPMPFVVMVGPGSPSGNVDGGPCPKH